MGVLDSKVVAITGAARGQGRSHAIRCAEEGADVIALDICADIDTVPYPLGTAAELAQTAAAVEARGRKITTFEVDVRDLDGLSQAISEGVSQLGRLDVVVANAAIAPCPPSELEPASIWRDVIDVNLTGVWNTIQATQSHLIECGRGGSITLINSTAGLKALPLGTIGGRAYSVAKHGLVGLMRNTAQDLAQHMVRVNTVHPTGVGTPMVVNPPMQEYIGANPSVIDSLNNLMPVEMVEPVDISNAIVWLASDAARYVNGVTLPVDAGFLTR